MRLIVSAAMLMDDGLIIPGVRHFSDEMRLVLHRIYGDGYHKQVVQQGFVDQRGTFLSREEAWKVADAAGQIRRPTGSEKFNLPRKAMAYVVAHEIWDSAYMVFPEEKDAHDYAMEKVDEEGNEPEVIPLYPEAQSKANDSGTKGELFSENLY